MISSSFVTTSANRRQLAPKEVLHFIRAIVEDIQKGAGRDQRQGEIAVERQLSHLLSHALATRSLLDIALVLGCAAELMIFPEQEVLEQCTAAVQKSDQPALRGLVWAVRHRCIRGGKEARRFTFAPMDEGVVR